MNSVSWILQQNSDVGNKLRGHVIMFEDTDNIDYLLEELLDPYAV